MRPTTDLQRRVAPFRVQADFVPAGDQPAAIDALEQRISAGESDVVVLGATGTGKTATVAWLAWLAWLAERLQRPMLVMQPSGHSGTWPDGWTRTSAPSVTQLVLTQSGVTAIFRS